MRGRLRKKGFGALENANKKTCVCVCVIDRERARNFLLFNKKVLRLSHKDFDRLLDRNFSDQTRHSYLKTTKRFLIELLFIENLKAKNVNDNMLNLHITKI